MSESLKISKQFMSVLMVILQKCLMEQSDIVPPLEELELEVEDGEVFVKNPPTTLFKPVSEEPEEEK